jgi:diguanylate cyclase (GGDEF)-like protein
MRPSSELELIRAILKKVATTLSSEKILCFTLQGIKDSFKCLAAAIVLIDARAETCKVLCAKGWGNEFVKKFHARPFQGLVREMAARWEPVCIKDDDSRKGAEGYVFQHDYDTLLALPLSVRGKPVGLLYLSWGAEVMLDRKTQEILTDMANLCTLILDHGSLDDKVLSMSNIDPLTGLYSYKFWHEELHREITRAEKLNSQVVLMVINLSRFKEFNAMHGHVKGDELLVETSEVIDRELGKLDVPCRIGGKWHVLLVGEDREGAGGIARRIIDSFEQLPFAGNALTHLSIGLSMYRPGEGEKALIERVDDAVLEARRLGGNACHAI